MAYIESLTTNWFAVSSSEQLRQIVGMIECEPMQRSGKPLQVHEKDGKFRLTMMDCVDTRLDWWDEEEEEDIDFIESLVGLLAKGEVLRVTSVSWHKGELARFMYDVYTADGRTYSMNTMDAERQAAEQLGIPMSALQSR